MRTPLLAAALLALGGCASIDGDCGRPGLYLGAHAIRSYESFDTHDSGVTTGDSDLGAGARLGFRVSPGLAVEAVAENVKGFQVESGTVDADLDLLTVGLQGKLFLSDSPVQPYLLAGGGAARSDVDRRFDLDDDGGYLRGGAGVDVYLTDGFAVTGEVNYNRMVGGVSDLHHIDALVGILFRF